MNEVLEMLVGKVCSVEINGNCNIVKIKALRGNWLVVEDNEKTAYINIERIDEIREI